MRKSWVSPSEEAKEDAKQKETKEEKAAKG
jgi:hypothetical protein